MKTKRAAIELFLCCLASAGLIHSIPAGYRVEQVYELTGNAGNPAEVPLRLASVLRAQLRNQNVPPNIVQGLRCSEISPGQRYGCSSTLHRRTEARELARQLSEVVPTKVGWIRAEVLKTRLSETQTQLGAWNREFASLDKEVRSLDPQVQEAEKSLEKIRPKKEMLENDLSNRKKQLAILEEAIPNRSASETRSRFEKKREEVVQIIQNLQAQLDRTDQEILKFSEPIDRKKKIEEALPKLRAQIDLARTQVTSWKAILASAKNSTLLADPDSFQLAALQGPRPIIPVRSWTHFPWSFLLGSFFFALIRRKELSGWRSRYFQTPEEVVEETGLPYLGRI